MITAIEFGEDYRSCKEALIWRRSLPHGTTQAEAYLVCPRGDWLIWQLTRSCIDQEMIEQALKRALDKIVARAIRRGVRSLRGNKKPWAKEYRGWARRWLSGEDRSRATASSAEAAAASAFAAAASAFAVENVAYAAADVSTYASEVAVYTAAEAAAAVARKKEQKLQAQDIRSEIPVWPGKE